MPLIYVTAFYVLPGYKYQTLEIYLERLEMLIQTGIPLICYLDVALREKGYAWCQQYPNLQIPEYVTLDTSWIPENVHMPFQYNKEKDTKEYFAIQLQKAWCLSDAVKYTKTPHLAWIDAGIFRVFKDPINTTKALQTIATCNWPESILAPGSWTEQDMEVDYTLNTWAHFLDYIRWRYLGGFLIGPRDVWKDVFEKQTLLVKATLPRIGWEVNYWWKLSLFKWYQAYHSDDMIVNALQHTITVSSVSDYED